MEKYDSIVSGALSVGQSEALKRKNTEFNEAHLLWGFLENPQSYSSKSLKNYKNLVKSLLDQQPQGSKKINLDQLRPSPKLSEWFTLASSHSIQAGKTELREQDFLRYLPQIFPKLDINYDDLRINENEDEQEVPAFLVNLNNLATQGKLDPVIGRSMEIRSVMEILGRRGKNNPVLVGPAGVGKTAIVEGLANEILKGSVPDVLKGKIVYSLDMGGLMAGTKFRGEFEERIQALLKFIKSHAGEVILFIDEIHQLVGAGKTDGAMDAANLLKPALARGELNCIGATTLDEYQKYILGDSALDRRFRSVNVAEPSVEDTIEILMGLREKFEIHHGVKISEEAIYNAAFLSDQYITNKNLPDKAIDLVDEAASSLKLSAEAMPSKLVELESEIKSKKILSQVEKNNSEIKKEIETLQKDFDEKKREWEKEVLALKQVSEIKNKIDNLKFELEQAEREQNYELAGKIKYSLLPELSGQLETTSHHWILGIKDIANVISRHTGIPLEKILKSKQDHILNLEDYLKNRVFGQDLPIKEICETLIASHAGLSDKTRPLGSFMLKGPSGVGKTETAKGLSQFLFSSEKNLVRLDMSEFSEKHSVAKLIGAPAGYVGYDEGGILTEAVRRHPYSIILFDEIEKAHPDFSDILLQILDDGRLTDNKGRTIDFKNTVIFLTTNSKNIELDFKPEVLGRIDAVLDYNPLDQGIVKNLIKKQLDLLNERLHAKNVKLELDDTAVDLLSEKGHDPQYGARPLQSWFNKLIIRPLSKELLKGELPEGVLKAKYLDGQMNFQVIS